MYCKTACSLAIVFLVSNLYLLLSPNIFNEYDTMKKTFSKEELERYKKITDERKNISIRGYIYGVVLSILFFIVNHYLEKNRKFSVKYTVCIVGAITFVTHYLYYILYPKSDYMIVHLDKKGQREAWLKIYRTMQYRSHMGFVCGIIAAMLMCYGLYK